MANDDKMDMTTGPLFKKIVIFSIPLVLSNILQLLFNAADVIVIGNFSGPKSLAAVGATTALINLLVNLLIGLSIGSNVIISQSLGAKKDKEVSDTVHTSVTFSLICGFALAVFGIFISKYALRLMGTPDDIIDKAALYMKIYFAGVPLVMLYNYCYAIMRALGDTKRPMQYLIMSGFVNVILNLFFVIIVKIDVAGVAIATVIAQGISGFLILRRLSKIDNCCKFEFKKMTLKGKILLRMIKIGLPAGIQSSMFSISNVLIQSSINSFGSLAMAGASAAGNIEGFVWIAMDAINQTTMNFVAQNFGAERFDRIKKVIWIDLAYVVIIGLFLGGGAYIFAKPLLNIYVTDSVAIGHAMVRLHYICLQYYMCGIMNVFVGTLRGFGKSTAPMIISIFGVCVVRIIWIFTLFEQYPTASVLYLSYPVTWIITAVTEIIYLIPLWNKIRLKCELTSV